MKNVDVSQVYKFHIEGRWKFYSKTWKEIDVLKIESWNDTFYNVRTKF